MPAAQITPHGIPTLAAAPLCVWGKRCQAPPACCLRQAPPLGVPRCSSPDSLRPSDLRRARRVAHLASFVHWPRHARAPPSTWPPSAVALSTPSPHGFSAARRRAPSSPTKMQQLAPYKPLRPCVQGFLCRAHREPLPLAAPAPLSHTRNLPERVRAIYSCPMLPCPPPSTVNSPWRCTCTGPALLRPAQPRPLQVYALCVGRRSCACALTQAHAAASA